MAFQYPSSGQLDRNGRSGAARLLQVAVSVPFLGSTRSERTGGSSAQGSFTHQFQYPSSGQLDRNGWLDRSSSNGKRVSVPFLGSTRSEQRISIAPCAASRSVSVPFLGSTRSEPPRGETHRIRGTWFQYPSSGQLDRNGSASIYGERDLTGFSTLPRVN